MAEKPQGILYPDKLEELKGLLIPNMGYTDQELQSATFIFISTPLVAANVIGAAEADPKTIGVVAMLSLPIIADFINRGIIDPVSSNNLLTGLEDGESYNP